MREDSTFVLTHNFMSDLLNLFDLFFYLQLYLFSIDQIFCFPLSETKIIRNAATARNSDCFHIFKAIFSVDEYLFNIQRSPIPKRVILLL